MGADLVLSDWRRVFGLVVELLEWPVSVRRNREKGLNLGPGYWWCGVLCDSQQNSRQSTSG